MAREYHWGKHGADHAVLYGPEPYMIAAIVTMEHKGMESRWVAISARYPSVNFLEDDASIPLEQIMERVHINIRSDLELAKRKIEEDICNVSDLRYREEDDDPYEY